MKSTGEYGEFFPISLSSYAYNETTAQDYFPLSKEEALTNGYRWKDKQTQKYEKNEELMSCGKCSKNYRTLEQEKDLYNKIGIKTPKFCAECRHLDLIAEKNPRRLWDRKCQKCSTEIQTSYSPDRPETIYCKKCYRDWT